MPLKEKGITSLYIDPPEGHIWVINGNPELQSGSITMYDVQPTIVDSVRRTSGKATLAFIRQYLEVDFSTNPPSYRVKPTQTEAFARADMPIASAEGDTTGRSDIAVESFFPVPFP